MANALNAFREARQLYEDRQFTAARARMAEYCNNIDYRAFTKWDKRPVTNKPPRWSVVIVSYGTGTELLKCLDSIFAQQHESFEVVLVNNGNNDAIKPYLHHYPLYYIETPENLLPSEGRNIGAWSTRGEYLAFIDDDGLVVSDYLQEGEKALAEPNVIGARGKVLPKSEGGAVNSHYDLGQRAQPSTFNLEGNMVIQRSVFVGSGGFDPLMFGYEGRELAMRCQSNFNSNNILYWPKLILKHDFAAGIPLDEKKNRQTLGIEYIKFISADEDSKESLTKNLRGERQVAGTGISVVLRAGNSLDAATSFLDQFCKKNTYKPIEVVLLFRSPGAEHLKIISKYTATHITILPISNKSLADIGNRVRYDTLLFVSTPANFNNDWLKKAWKSINSSINQTRPLSPENMTNSFMLSRASALSMTSIPAYATLQEINKISENSPEIVADEVAGTKLHWEVKQGLAGYPLDTQIDVLEVELSLKDEQLSELYQEIEKLDREYEALAPDCDKAKNLKQHIKSILEDSNERLKELKSLHDALERLRIKKYSIIY